MSFLQSNDVARKAEIDAREKCFEVQISIFDNCSDHLPQDALQRSEDLVKVETNRCVDYEAKLNRELDQSQMKKMIIAMVDARLGALEASSAELLRVQSASLESLPESQCTTHNAAKGGEGRPRPPDYRICQIA